MNRFRTPHLPRLRAATAVSRWRHPPDVSAASTRKAASTSRAPPPAGGPPFPWPAPETIQVEDGQIRFSAPYVATVFGKVNADLYVTRQRFTFTTVQANGFGGRASLSGFVGRQKGEGWAMQINVADGKVREMTRGTTLEGKNLEGRLDGFLSHAVNLNFILRLLGELPLGIETVREAASPATDFFTKNFLLDVEVKGTWSDPKARPLPVRVVSKPIVDLLEGLVRSLGE